jgi:predicted nucleic acid-binding protein
VRYVLDASVAVAAARPNEPTYRAAYARLLRILSSADDLVIPAIFPIEVASALARTGSPAPIIELYVDSLLQPPTELVTLGPMRARKIQGLAVRLKLRAADATYAWVAMRAGVPLVTSDQDVLQRAGAVCQVEEP